MSSEPRVRTARVDEFDELMALMARSFGHSADFFPRVFPHLYRPEQRCCDWAHVVDVDGQLLAHVGVYPVDLVLAGASVPLAGIGGVATAPEARARGYMTLLLNYIVKHMRDKGYVVSGLGGDRQRYGAFGWETSGTVCSAYFTPRSLERDNVQAVALEECRACDGVDAVSRFHSTPLCHTRRPYLELQLQKPGYRLWTAEDGYVIASGEGHSALKVVELVSTSGREAGMLRSVLNANRGPSATWMIPVADEQVITRVLPAAAGWHSQGSWMFRIVDLTGLLTAFQPLLQQRAQGGSDFDLSLGIREHDQLDTARLTFKHERLKIGRARGEPSCVLESAQAVRLFFGTPHIGVEGLIPETLSRLLPLPMYVPPLDHV